MRRALVTGATGFVGSHLVEELTRKDYEVTCLVRRSSDLKWLEPLKVSTCVGDCRDPRSLEEAVKGKDFVFHLAGLTKARRDSDLLEANARGTENVVGAVARHNPGLRRFVHVSSLAAVGPCVNGRPATEETEPRPVSVYGRSKLEAEAAVIGLGDRVPVTVVRPPAVYGPRDRDFLVFFRMVRRGVVPYWGRCSYSLIYVDDLVRGIVEAAESPAAAGEVFFLSEGEYTNDAIADVIAEAVGRKPIRLRVPRGAVSVLAGIGQRLGGPGIFNRDKARELAHDRWACDPSTAGVKLGFRAKIRLNEGLKWTANWYRIHPWL